MRRFRDLYGAGPVHAIGMLASFAFAAYIVSRVLHVSYPGWLLVWLVGAIAAHDLVLFPLYSALDRLLLSQRLRRRTRSAAVPWKNHVRVPVVMSAILLLITFPLVFRLSEGNYFAASGLHTSVYLDRWLAVSGCVFAGSALLYAARRIVHRGRSPAAAETTEPST